MPADNVWPTEEEEAMLDAARAEADAGGPVSEGYEAWLARECASAGRDRLSRPSPFPAEVLEPTAWGEESRGPGH